jgi:hypothetical protein
MLVLRFEKTGRRADLTTSRNPVGIEITCLVDSELTWSQTVRSQSALRVVGVRTRRQAAGADARAQLRSS